MNVVIVDYGLGNLFSVQQACSHTGVEASISSNKSDILSADAVILPGVGAFGRAIENLHERDIFDALQKFAADGKPIFGICLGMQLLFDESEEFGDHEGLGIVKGKVKKLPHVGERVPRVGWYGLERPDDQVWLNTPLRTFTDKSDDVYFVHSFYVDPINTEDILATTHWGKGTYCSAVLKGNVLGCQFHPEKSGPSGLEIFKSFFHDIRD